MTDYRDRHLELRLREELSGEQPPDQVQNILEAANQLQQSKVASQQTLAEETSSAEINPVLNRPLNGHQVVAPVRRRNRWLFPAIAASLVIVVGVVLLPLLPSGNRPIVYPDPDNNHSKLYYEFGLAIPETTEAVNVQGQPMLRDGWVFVQPHSNSMLVGLSQVKFHDARAVVRMGRVPDSYETMEMAQILANSKVDISQEELEMLKNTRSWIAGLGLAVCLLSGEMVLGQEKISAQTNDNDFTVADVFDRFDTNENGTIEMDECVCEHSKSCDLNQDGKITRKEFNKSIRKMAGSEQKFLHMVAQFGGVEKFYTAAEAGLLKEVANVSFDAVFAHLDQDQSGVLEKAECICKGSKSADLNHDGTVTKKELRKTAINFFGSEDAFLETVRQAGGVKAFFTKANATEECTNCMSQVFAAYDKDQSGVLEKGECICKGSKMADANGDGKVTQQELESVAVKMFGSIEKFEAYIESCGGAQKFYEGVVNGKIQ